MKSIFGLVFAIAVFQTPDSQASRACTPEDYGIVQAEVFNCQFTGSDGSRENVQVAASALSLKVDTSRRKGSFSPGRGSIELSKLQCPEDSSLHRLGEPTYRNGLRISVEAAKLPLIEVQRDFCVISRQGYHGEMEPDFEFEIRSQRELVHCQSLGSHPVPTKNPGFDVCGFPDEGY